MMFLASFNTPKINECRLRRSCHGLSCLGHVAFHDARGCDFGGKTGVDTLGVPNSHLILPLMGTLLRRQNKN